jgi:hypothetical protein
MANLPSIMETGVRRGLGRPVSSIRGAGAGRGRGAGKGRDGSARPGAGK